MTEHNTAIEVSNMSFSYGSNKVLDNISFSIAPRTLCALVGPNGSGKTTLIRCITGLIEPNKGSVNVACSHNTKQDPHTIGYVEQRHIISSDFPVSVYEVVASGLTTGNKKWFLKHTYEKSKVEHALESVGLLGHIHSSMSSLSGGQQQRVLIAKAFVSDPDVLILDEPIAGVDTQSQELFRDALLHIIEEHDTTVLLVSHELSAVQDILDQIIVLKNRVLFNGTPQQLNDQGVSLGMHSHDLPMWLERIDHDTNFGENDG